MSKRFSKSKYSVFVNKIDLLRYFFLPFLQMNFKLLTAFIFLFFSLNSNSKMPLRIFDSFVCIPDGYYIFNKNSNEVGIRYHPSNSDDAIIQSGDISFIPDPIQSDVF